MRRHLACSCAQCTTMRRGSPFTLSHNIVVCSRTIHNTKNLQARQRGQRVFPNSCLLAALFLYPAMQGKGVTQISELVEHDPWVICMRESKSPMSRWHGHPLCRHLSPEVCCRHGPGAINGQGLQGLLSAYFYGRSTALCSQDTHKAIKVPGISLQMIQVIMLRIQLCALDEAPRNMNFPLDKLKMIDYTISISIYLSI